MGADFVLGDKDMEVEQVVDAVFVAVLELLFVEA